MVTAARQSKRNSAIGYQILIALFVIGLIVSMVFGFLGGLGFVFVVAGWVLSVAMAVISIPTQSRNWLCFASIPLILNYGILGFWLLGVAGWRFDLLFKEVNTGGLVLTTAPFLFLYWVGVGIYGYIHSFRNNY